MLFVRWDPDPSAAVRRTSNRDSTGRTSGRFRAFVTHKRGDEKPGFLLFAPSFLGARFCPCALLLASPRTRSDSRNCQRQRRLSQPLMVFERGRSDAEDVRTHAGQITILPLFSANWIFSSRALRHRGVGCLVSFLLPSLPLLGGNERRQDTRLFVDVRDKNVW